MCKKHPKYKGVLPPRVPCSECWEIYLSNQIKNGNIGKVAKLMSRLQSESRKFEPTRWRPWPAKSYLAGPRENIYIYG